MNSGIKQAGEGRAVWVVGDHYTIKAGGEDTGGAFTLIEVRVPPQSGPPPHIHRREDEAFYVLEGSVKLYDGRAWLDAGPGDFVHVPEGGIHAFANESDAPAAMLILFAPGVARERFFTATAQIANAGRELLPEEWTAFYAEHDQFMVDADQ